jgi:hypothetical protein
MPDVEVKPANPSSELDNPSFPTAIKPSWWNAARLFSGGTSGQLVQRDSTAGTGASYTSLPTVTAMVFPLTAPGTTPPNGGFWVEDDGTTVTLKIRRANGDIVSLEMA